MITDFTNHFDLNKAEKTKAGSQYWLIDKNLGDGTTLKMSIVDPHKSTHTPHIHPEKEFFYVLGGTAEFYLNGKTIIGGANTSFFCPSNYEHRITNIGETPLRYLVVKKYVKN